MIVKWAPRLATILCLYKNASDVAATEDDDDKDTWLGRFAMPIPSVMGARVAIRRGYTEKDS